MPSNVLTMMIEEANNSIRQNRKKKKNKQQVFSSCIRSFSLTVINSLRLFQEILKSIDQS